MINLNVSCRLKAWVANVTFTIWGSLTWAEIDNLLTFAALCLLLTDVCRRRGLCLFLERQGTFSVFLERKMLLIHIDEIKSQIYLVAYIRLARPLHDLIQTLSKDTNNRCVLIWKEAHFSNAVNLNIDLTKDCVSWTRCFMTEMRFQSAVKSLFWLSEWPWINF